MLSATLDAGASFALVGARSFFPLVISLTLKGPGCAATGPLVLIYYMARSRVAVRSLHL